MTIKEAKQVIRSDPYGDVVKRLEAIGKAEEVLGADCTMEDIWKWAEESEE